MSAKTILPEGKYKVAGVGPSKETSFTGDNGLIEFTVTSIQLEGHTEMWVEVNSGKGKPVPAVGDELNGHVEQDEAGKYLPKFKKAKGNWGGGGGSGKASPGAIWSSAVQTATQLVVGYYTASGKKPKSFDEFLGKVDAVAPKVNAIIDKHVGAPSAAASSEKSDSEAGVTPGAAPEKPAAAAEPAANPKVDVVIEDISDDDLGDW